MCLKRGERRCSVEVSLVYPHVMWLLYMDMVSETCNPSRNLGAHVADAELMPFSIVFKDGNLAIPAGRVW